MRNLVARYPTQIDGTDLANYPQGKAKNRLSAGDKTGTPWEKDIINEWLGSMQAIVAAGAVTVSGLAERVGASDVLTGIVNLITARLALSTYTPSRINPTNIGSVANEHARTQLIGLNHYK